MAEARMNPSLGCDFLKSGLAMNNRFRCINDPSKATATIPNCAASALNSALFEPMALAEHSSSSFILMMSRYGDPCRCQLSWQHPPIP